ncbi:hypothetical protein PoB_001261300 [Plakobranchus ocellatus]|uniref:Uncharacterized protein n=1 Tax=Plakobranchus ocellatus TaxID=259542 RepID=A0AAV3YV50_9GAST|nr:hypothetical protein PoB_001261300 [Plakobranchus ocellatus]
MQGATSDYCLVLVDNDSVDDDDDDDDDDDNYDDDGNGYPLPPNNPLQSVASQKQAWLPYLEAEIANR